MIVTPEQMKQMKPVSLTEFTSIKIFDNENTDQKSNQLFKIPNDDEEKDEKLFSTLKKTRKLRPLYADSIFSLQKTCSATKTGKNQSLKEH